jgi:Flp pilus assembly pilin Flp
MTEHILKRFQPNQNKILRKQEKQKIMKKFFNNVKARFNKATAAVKARVECAKATVENQLGEGYIDTAVKIIIGVVIGGVLLAGLYTLFNATVMPTLSSKITEMFTYSGT